MSDDQSQPATPDASPASVSADGVSQSAPAAATTTAIDGVVQSAPATPPAPVPPPVQAPIQSTITATAPNPAPAADAPKVDSSSTDNHKGAIQLHLVNAINEAKERRSLYRETALIIKEDRFIQHLEGMLATLRQLSLRVF